MYSEPNLEGAVAYALTRLREEIPPEYTYHNVLHTENDVIPATARLAKLCRLTEQDSRLLQLAAAYHDVGFVETFVGHEEASVRIMAQALPGFGYPPEYINRTAKLIMATRLPQSPNNLLEEILADADLDVLGRVDFMPRSEDLRQESANRGIPIARRPWYEQQLEFMKHHVYFTQAARDLREAGKLRNMALLKEKLGDLC
jgi:uncharacterized protein